MEVTWIHVEEGLYSINISYEYLLPRESEGVRNVRAVATKTGGTRAAWARSPQQSGRPASGPQDNWAEGGQLVPLLPLPGTAHDRLALWPRLFPLRVKFFFAFTQESAALCLPHRTPTRGL